MKEKFKTIFEKKVSQFIFIVTERSFSAVESLNGEFMSSILHLVPLIYPLFTGLGPDPYSEYGSSKVLNTW